MNNRRSPSRLVLPLVALLSVSTLPSCLTQKVWEGHGCEGAEEEMSTAARVAVTPVALAGDALVAAAMAVVLVGPYAFCGCR